MRPKLKQVITDDGRSTYWIDNEQVKPVTYYMELDRRRERDRFARAALTGLLARSSDDWVTPRIVTDRAYALADAMMTAREGDEE